MALLALGIVINVTTTIRNASIVWPSSWALDARWPWWISAFGAAFLAFLLREEWRRG